MKKEQLGKNLKYMRECHNMSQSQLAGKLWLDRSSISGYEIGKRMPDILILWEMAEIMNVSLDELVGRKRWVKQLDYKKGIAIFWEKCYGNYS